MSEPTRDEPGQALSEAPAQAAAPAGAAASERSLWEQDSQRLPRGLREHRRKLRAFAQTELRSRSLRLDRESSAAEQQAMLQEVLQLTNDHGLQQASLAARVGVGARLFPQRSLLARCTELEETFAACGGLGALVGAHNLGVEVLRGATELQRAQAALSAVVRRGTKTQPARLAWASAPVAARVTSGDTGRLVLREPAAVIARPVDGGFRLRGLGLCSIGGAFASAFAVIAASEEQPQNSACFCVDASSEGLTRRAGAQALGLRAAGLAVIDLEDVLVPSAGALGACDERPVGLQLLLAAAALGIARGAMDSAIAFACRYKLGASELLRDALVQAELASLVSETASLRASVWHAAGNPQLSQAGAALVSLTCHERALAVCESACDLLGHHALIEGNFVEKALRDLCTLLAFSPAAHAQRLLVIEQLQAQLLARVEAVR